MAKRKKSTAAAYTLLSIPLSGYRASVDASISHEARDKRYHYADPKIYSFGSSMALEGICDYPNDRAGEKYSITVYARDDDEGHFDARLSDVHVRDDDGIQKYRRERGKDVPVYDLPEGIGLIEKDRSSKDWSGSCWVAHQAVSDMLTLLPHVRPLYISIHERKVGRNRWINGLTLQTSHPAFE